MAIATRRKNFAYGQNFEISTGPRGVPMGVVKAVTPAIIGNFVFLADNFRNFFNKFPKYIKNFRKVSKKLSTAANFFQLGTPLSGPAKNYSLAQGKVLLSHLKIVRWPATA